MNFIKEVLKKLFLAAITGVIILAFVYYKDSYLEEDTSDMEILKSVSLEKEKLIPNSDSLKAMNTVEDSAKEISSIVTKEEPLKIEVSSLAENVTIDTQSKVEEKKAKTEQTFEEYKNSLNPDRKADAFNELDEETKF